MANLYLTRISKLIKLLNNGKRPAAVVLSGNPKQFLSHDTEYPYRPNSDLFYLAGTRERDLTIIIRNFGEQKVIVIGSKIDPHRALWEGKAERPAPIAKRIGAELVISQDHVTTALKYLRGGDILYSHSTPDTTSARVRDRITTLRTHERRPYPLIWCDAHEMLAPLRLFKDRHEIAFMEEAAAITGLSMLNAIPLIQPKTSERSIAAAIEFSFYTNGCEVAFPSIVAAGPNAAVLHYSAMNREVKAGDMVLMDCGAQLELYCSDLTRVIPVNGTFSPIQRDVYETVLAAQKAAIKTIRHGVPIHKVFLAAAKEITQGLVMMGVLRGKVSKLVEKRAFAPWFPHSIGHSLGLDTHDIGHLRGGKDVKLEAGMVITVEPGLYFSKPIKKVPACGVRIEDDVLVTKSKAEVLSDGVFPKEIGDIETICQQY